jgi:6-phosphogluconate dehydrogenase
MQIAMIGLGRMGANMARRLMRGGHQCLVYDVSPARVRELEGEGAAGVASLDELRARLDRPRTAWIMVPAGDPTEQTVSRLATVLERGDAIVDGGNTHFKDDVRRAEMLAPHGIQYVDVGTSGGVWGLERGYCLMIGGHRDAARRLDPVFRTLAPGTAGVSRTPGREARTGTADEGYLHVGPTGAGHFVKMIHNGIEYGLMQAYAEGFDVLKNASSASLAAPHRYDLDLADIAEVWRRGSVIGSWLLDLAATALAENPTLANYTGYVEDSGEGRWTINAAIEEAVPVHVLSSALYARFRSRQDQSFADRMLSALRRQFGGHVEPPAGE